MNDFLIYKNDKRLCGLFICLLITLTAVFYLFVCLPRQAELREKRQMFAMKQYEIKVLQAVLNAHPNTEEYERELKKKVDEAHEALPETMDFGEFIGTLQRMAQKCGLTVKGILPGRVVKQEKLYTQDLKADFVGSYQDVLNFLAELEQQKRFINITAATIKADNDGTLSVVLEIRLYALEIE